MGGKKANPGTRFSRQAIVVKEIYVETTASDNTLLTGRVGEGQVYAEVRLKPPPPAPSAGTSPSREAPRGPGMTKGKRVYLKWYNTSSRPPVAFITGADVKVGQAVLPSTIVVEVWTLVSDAAKGGQCEENLVGIASIDAPESISTNGPTQVGIHALSFLLLLLLLF